MELFREEPTVGVDLTPLTLGNGKERGPAREVGEVEADVIILGEGVEVGMVEFEEVERVEGPQRRHSRSLVVGLDPSK